MIKTTPTTEITLDTAGIAVGNNTEVEAFSADQCINTASPNEMTAVKKEYSIVGDAFYAGTNSDAAPTWLTNLITSVVEASVANGLTDYNLLVQDVRNAIDSIDVAKNTYVEQINFTSLVDGIIGSHLSTLNVTYDGKFATIADLDVVKVNAESALALRASDLRAEFSSDINSRITSVELAYSSADEAFANSIDALTTAFIDQESNLAATASAVEGLQTYTGLDKTTNNPNGLGMLARLDVLEKQVDGSVDVVSNTYDVMGGVEDPNEDTTNDSLVLDALPYVLWTNMEGSGTPTATQRSYMDYSLAIPALAQTDILEGTLYTNNSFTDTEVDKYFKYNTGTWSAISTAVFNNLKDVLKNYHTGDTYIMYEDDNGTKTYLRSYKFVKTLIDTEGPNYSTDSEGYTWALITDSASQAAYTLALEAIDMADGKMSHFYAWGGNVAPTSYNVVTKAAEYLTDDDGNYLDSSGDIATDPADFVESVPETVEQVNAEFVALWFTGNILYKKGTTWGDKSPVPTIPGNGNYIAIGDMLTVFDPVEGDTATYWFNGVSWQINSPSGVVSKSKWFIDLDNAVYGKHGHMAVALNDLKVENKSYADDQRIEVENLFSYDSAIYLDGKYYRSGFGLDSSGVTQINDGLTENTAFDSEFWVNAERFVLKSPTYPDKQAVFKVTETGIQLGIEHTEATKNNVRGEFVLTNDYEKGDIVSYQGSSWAALTDVTGVIPAQTASEWQLFAEKGEAGSKVDFLFTRNAGVPDDPDANTDVWYTGVNDVPAGSGELWSVKATDINGNIVYSDKRIIEAEVVREILLYSYAIPIVDSLGVPTLSTYNFSTGSLTVNDVNWSQSLPSVLPNEHKILACTALVTGNRTELSKDVTWSIPTVFTQRVDGKEGTSGGEGTAGSRGTAVFTKSINSSYTSPTEVPEYALSSYWNDVAPSGYGNEVYGDNLIVTNTNPTHGWTHIFTYNGVWESSNVFTVNGNQIVEGTILSKHLVTGTVTADKLLFNNSYLTTDNGLLSIASLTDSDSVKLSGDNTGAETLSYVIPPRARLVMYGALSVYGTANDTSVATFQGHVTKTDTNVIVSSSLSIGSVTGLGSVNTSPQFNLSAYNNHPTQNKTCKIRINLTATRISGADSSITYMYMIMKR